MIILRSLQLNKLLLLAMLLLPIGLSAVSLAHAMEIDQDSHEQHQCEIYDAIEQALNTDVILIVYSNTTHSIYQLDPSDAIVRFKALPRTRSSPQSV